MKKKIIALIIAVALIASVCTGLIIAKAGQENNMEYPCLHEYSVTEVQNGRIVYTCEYCNDAYTDYFSNHINSDYPAMDCNGDGFVNVRDYTIIYQQTYN